MLYPFFCFSLDKRLPERYNDRMIQGVDSNANQSVKSRKISLTDSAKPLFPKHYYASVAQSVEQLIRNQIGKIS